MMRRAFTLIPLATVLGLSACVGPGTLRRSLDQTYNQVYVDSPFLCQVSMPLFEVGLVGAAIIDGVIVNPVYFWKDALRGEGTPHYYRNPTIPEEGE